MGEALAAYKRRTAVTGQTKREASRNRELRYLTSKMPESLSYKDVLIGDTEQSIMIVGGDELDTKSIQSLPGETLTHGGLVTWNDEKWLITETDADAELYEKGTMQRCNHLLKWLNESGTTVERWCIVEDGTKYLIGEKTEKMMAIGDARIAVTIGKDAETAKLGRGRRFIIDDSSVTDPLVYQITKPNRLYKIYAGEGIYRFILNEVNLTASDNVELRIADYYTTESTSSDTSGSGSGTGGSWI